MTRIHTIKNKMLKICKGEIYAPVDPKWIYLKNNVNFLKINSLSFFVKMLSSLFLLFLVSLAHAQDQPSDSGQLDLKSLSIGDSVPDYLWNMPLNTIGDENDGGQITLNRFKDKKLILLDFWSTTCAPCLRLIPKIEQIAEEVGPEFVPIPITPEKKDRVVDFLKAKELDFWSAVDASPITKFFQVRGVPHEIWIKDGKIFGITGGSAVSLNTVKGIMNGAIKKLPEKVFNSSYDEDIPLLVDGNGGNSPDLMYHSLFTGYLPGVQGRIQGELEGGRYYFRYTNQSPISLYRNMASKLDPQFTLSSRNIFQGVDLDYIKNLNPDDSIDRSHLYGYELIVPNSMKEEMVDFSLEDLNRFFSRRYGFQAAIKLLEVDCWVIEIGDSSKLPLSKGNEKMWEKHEVIYCENIAIASYVNLMNAKFHKQTSFIVDESGYEQTVNLKCFEDEDGFTKTKAFLEMNGFKLSKGRRNLEVLEFSQYHRPTTE